MPFKKLNTTAALSPTKELESQITIDLIRQNNIDAAYIGKVD